MHKTKTAAASRDRSVLSAAEAAKSTRRDLEIGAKKTVELDASSAMHARVRLGSIDDLKRMSFLPEGLDEKRLADAIRADDDEAMQNARHTFRQDAHACACGGGAGEMRPADAFRAHYDRLRGQCHPHLARSLTEVYRRDIAWDDLLAVHAYRWRERLRVRAFDIDIFLLRDIIVGKNGTLSVSPSAKLLWANDIRIHVGGTIRSSGSYLKIKCASIQGNIA
jgi:hypothetical protein